VRKLLLLLALCVVGAGLVPGRAAAIDACGRPEGHVHWIDYGRPEWASIFGRPGTILAVSSGDFPAQMRAKGALTVYWDMYLNRRVGTPTAPAPMNVVIDKANILYEYASAQTACSTPWIALNELFGASLPTPWSATNTVYRANVLAFIKVLAEHGAHVFLLVNSKPYTADEAGDWWREVAKYSDFVREVYFPAPLISGQGPVLGNRTMRNAFRDGILDLTSIGIPVTKMGLFLGFQTEKGNGGREGLAKLAWFRTIKWQALAAKQVAAELHFPTIWSWGWGEWGGQSVDPDKPAAACVYLWARDHSLCNGPKAAGSGFNTSMTEGQIDLPRGVQCVVGGSPMLDNAIRRLVAVTNDRQVAFSAVFARTVEGKYAAVNDKDVLALERAVVAAHFHGSRSAYRAALAKAGANVALARGILGDELRQAAIESRIKVSQPSSSAISSFYDEFGSLPARQVGASTAPWWLGDRKAGLAISSVAPDQVFQVKVGRWSTVVSATGQWKVKPLGPVAPLAAFPLSKARPAIGAALRQSSGTSAYQSWTAAKQRSALKQTACRRDSLPSVGAVDLTSYLSFLAL
jgi:hypothetical protein